MALKNVFGDLALEETLQTLSVTLGALAHSLGTLSPDSTGRLRVVPETGTIATVTTVSSVTNVVSAGNYQMSYDQYGQMMQGVHSIRNCIQVS